MESRAPTRWARAFAFLIDGGLIVLTTLQAFSLTLYLRSLPPEDVEGFLDLALSSQARWFFVLGVFWLLVEVSQGHAFLRGAPSFGFAVTGLSLEGATRRPRLRRLTRMLLPIIAFFGIARAYLTSPDVLSLDVLFLGTTLVMAGTCAVTVFFAAVDAIVVISDPANRTLGDWLARTRVVANAPSGPMIRRALHVAALLTFAAAALDVVAAIEHSRAEHALNAVFDLPASLVAQMATLAVASALTTTYGPTCEPLGMRNRHPLAMALLFTLPVVSFFFARTYVKRVVEVLDLSHEASMGLRSVVDLAMGVRSVVALVLLYAGIDALRRQIAAFGTGFSAPAPLEPLINPLYLLGTSLLGTLALGVALQRLAKLDFDRLVPCAHAHLEEVFA